MHYALKDLAGTIAYALVLTLFLGVAIWWLSGRRLRPERVWPLGLALCWGIELWQLSSVPASLSARWIGWRLTLGTTFSWWDILFYPVGVILSVAVARLLRKLFPLRTAPRGTISERPHRTRTGRQPAAQVGSGDPGTEQNHHRTSVRIAWVPLLGHVLLSVSAWPYLLLARRWLLPWPWIFPSVLVVGAALHVLLLVTLMGCARSHQTRTGPTVHRGTWGRAVGVVMIQVPVLVIVVLLLTWLAFLSAGLGTGGRTAELVIGWLPLLPLGLTGLWAGLHGLTEPSDAGRPPGPDWFDFGFLLTLAAVIAWGVAAAPVPPWPAEDGYAQDRGPTTGRSHSPSASADLPSSSAPPGAAVACTTQDLGFTAGDWEFAVGNGYATLTAINRSGASCWLRGRPHLTLEQAGITLSTGRSDLSLPDQDQDRRVILAPGGQARAALAWRGYRDADRAEETPQRLSAGVAGQRETARVDFEDSPMGEHPFDLVDGGHLGVGTWAPATA
jgi:hypothetical protein